jgi:hypothetical protein
MSFAVGTKVYSSTGQSGVITMDHNGQKVVKMVHGTGQHGSEICTWAMNPKPEEWHEEPWFTIDASTKKRLVYEVDRAVLDVMGGPATRAWAHLPHDERREREIPVPLDHHQVIGFKELRVAVLEAVKKALSIE